MCGVMSDGVTRKKFVERAVDVCKRRRKRNKNEILLVKKRGKKLLCVQHVTIEVIKLKNKDLEEGRHKTRLKGGVE